MHPDQILLVQTSFARLAPAADAVASAFYRHLFELDPQLRRMFPSDLAAQRGKLMHMLDAAVRGLGDLPALLPTLHALGARHTTYGVRDHHYAVVGHALIDTLRHGLGIDFTPAVEQAWSAAFDALSGAMRAGARATAAHAA